MSANIKDVAETIRAHRFFAGLTEAFADEIAACASAVQFKAGTYLFHEADEASQFYLIREGRVALEIKAPGRSPLILQTVRAGEIVGVSWLTPPYRWAYDARALEPIEALAIDAACLRAKCDSNHTLGYEILQRFTPILLQRLHAARLQILDVYGQRG